MRATFVGTAGWSIPKPLRDRAPDTGSMLQRYSRVCEATELNSTFYRRHRLSTFERWRDSVPAQFRFAVKLPRSITHDAALLGPRKELSEFFDDVRGLGEKLGPVLVQLPASVHFDARRVASFFRALRELHPGLVACEPRHASWYSARADAIFQRYDIARVVADPPRPPAATEPLTGSSLLYVRWHGSPRIYWSAYGDERLAELARLVRQQTTVKQAWCVFDNTAAGAALDDALRFRELLDRSSLLQAGGK